jgi:3-phenylpropionate/trans-cinnamate dioxygenase ferredoxin reductase component
VPYERPHLSKGYLAGSVPADRLALRPAQQYEELGVELVLGARVVELGLEPRTIVLESGATLRWDLLCLATGSEAKELPGLAGAMHLRELPDAERLRSLIAGHQALDIIGAGFIGCEVAAVAVQQGCAVTVYERSPEPLSLILGPELGGYLKDVHLAHGVDLHLGRRSLPRLENHPLVAIGSVPRTGLAEQAGLLVDGGIIVDKRGRTSAPDVFAAGDATRFFSPLFGTHIRVEHFQGAQRQGFAVGRSMAGASEPYLEAPWFWSDQYDLNIQYVGAALPFDEVVVRGEVGKPPFTLFRRRSGELVTAIGFNDHHTVARARRLLEARKSVTAQQLADPSFDLRRALA